MRTLLIGAAVVLTLALIGGTLGQEVIPTPFPVEGTQSAAAGGVTPGDPAQASVAGPDNWRYHWYRGYWWYWTPAKCWMWYNDNRQWVEFDPTSGLVQSTNQGMCIRAITAPTIILALRSALGRTAM